MKTRDFLAIFSLGAVALLTPSASANVGLYESVINKDGVLSSSLLGDPPVVGTDSSLWNSATGLGTISMSFLTPGAHFAGLFVDHELSEAVNTFFNEYGDTSGAAGLSWEIDEPGFSFGNIYSHINNSSAVASLLDNNNGVPIGSPNDVSMALGWNFSLIPGGTATARFTVSSVAPASGFYLAQFDPDSHESVYFSSSLLVVGVRSVPDGSVPWVEPGLALAAITVLRRWMRREQTSGIRAI